MIRSILRRVLYTQNTIRYRVEWPRLENALRKAGTAKTLFDGGAGSGEFSRRALSGGYCKEVIALEYDASNFAYLKKNLGSNANVQLIHGSVLEIPLPDESVDLAMSTQVIEHIEDHDKAASEFVRILKPGGHLIITVPHPPEPFPNEGHFREGYTESDLRSLFEPLGLELLHTDYFLTKGTIERVIKATKLPLHGKFLPVAWADRESHLNAVERQADEPFGILVLFRKAEG